MREKQLLEQMGERVSARRRELRLTQEQVAEQMDVSVQMISNLEQGRKAIRPENLVKISRVLQVSADYILQGVHSAEESAELTRKILQLPPKQQQAIGLLIESMLDG